MDFLKIEDQKYVFIGEHSTLKGSIAFSGDTRLAAHIIGDVIMNDESPLIIEPNGKVEGSIVCHHLEIYGHVEGEVTVKGDLIVHSYGELHGKVHAKNFIIKPGAIINIDGKSLE
jgi:cytoskeletal protein CcmA (bactofilin family)